MVDFFISYNSADKDWAEWIAFILEENQYTTVIQVWDFRPGSNFALEMQKAASDANKTIIVLSNNYLKSRYTQPEWAAAFADDPTGNQRKLIPVKVEECSPNGLLDKIVHINIAHLDSKEAEKALLSGLKEDVRPKTKVKFPGKKKSVIKSA
ncbi:MAG: toll/interleukin-1 receptor domain-containing protein [Cyanobacteria bacterium J06621_8]